MQESGRRGGGGVQDRNPFNQVPIPPDKIGYLSQLWDETHSRFAAERGRKKFTKEEIEPLDNFLRAPKTKQGESLDKDSWNAIRAHIEALKQQVKDQGLWGFHLGPELGGPGFGQVKLCLLNEKLGRTRMGPTIFGCQAPDTGNMELIAHNGTEEQKKKYMEPLLSGEKHSAYSMTEPHAGEPGEFVCSAVRDGDEWVLNGEKWFTSNGAAADFLIVMAITSPETWKNCLGCCGASAVSDFK